VDLSTVPPERLAKAELWLHLMKTQHATDLPAGSVDENLLTYACEELEKYERDLETLKDTYLANPDPSRSMEGGMGWSSP
jgi:hypothetical protein